VDSARIERPGGDAEEMSRRWWIAILCAVALAPAAVAIAQDAVRAQVSPDDTAQAPQNSCDRTLAADFDPNKGDYFGRSVSIWQLQGGSAVLFQSGMTIDADGAPNAYNPENTGLDDISNAGQPGHWEGIVANGEGEPLLQGPDDPFPGYYISCTALWDRSKPVTDPTRFVDASKIPYIVLPGALSRQVGAQLGDLAFVFNTRNGRSSYAIFADIGTLGEGSMALAQRLGIWPDARNGGTRGGVVYLLFPASGNRQPRPVEDIDNTTDKIFQDWGGTGRLNTCMVPQASKTADAAPPAIN
jgi:hypothetical protein